MIEIENITKVYQMGETEVRALNGVSLKIEDGEWVAITGPSGSGKSTLMAIIGCLDSPTSGTYRLDGIEVAQMRDDELAAVRNQQDRFRVSDVQLAGAHECVGKRRIAAAVFQRKSSARSRARRRSRRWVWAIA